MSLGVPTDKDGEGITDPETHLKRYKLKHVKGEPKDVKVDGILVTNQFGEFVVEAHGPDHLLVPTLKDLHEPVDLPDPFDPGVDHFLCYKLKKVEVLKDLRKDVSIADQFGTADYEVKDGKWLCNPVEKQVGGEVTPIKNPDWHLMCFEIEEKDVEVYTYNQFGPETLVVDKPKVKLELCVPSKKTAP